MSNSNFFNQILENRKKGGTPDSQEMIDCMQKTVEELLCKETDEKKPGILLGQVQGGKTRAFIGIIALAFDKGYDWVIVFTKGTRALTKQTLIRLEKEFKDFCGDNDILQIYDIGTLPDNLNKFEINQKFIIVCKKEHTNTEKLLQAIDNYKDFKNKKLLIIDDEADYASLTFYKIKVNNIGEIYQGTISRHIDEIRNKVQRLSFLQVTATPYSLYLQPDDDERNMIFLPKRPSFDKLLPTFEGYVGGDHYFPKDNEDCIASYLYEQVPSKEIDILIALKSTEKGDKRSFDIENIFETSKLEMLKKSIINFIVGACIRRLQQAKQNKKQEHYCFLIHIATAKISHFWQREIVNKLNEQLEELLKSKDTIVDDLIKTSYDDITASIKFEFDDNTFIPTYSEVFDEVKNVIPQEMLLVQVVNSEEKNIEDRLDENGQLKLRTPLNIFIGGKVLDRGLTIRNLIGFYYGRNPKRTQQDTALQHSRMYGNRSKEDLVVTRFYTTIDIYNKLSTINEFDITLREQLKKEAMNQGVAFLRKDVTNIIIPCSPNKLLFSDIMILKPYTRLLPKGFDTGYKKDISPIIQNIDKLIDVESNGKGIFKLKIGHALNILDDIYKTLIFEEGYSWDIKSIKAVLKFISKSSNNKDNNYIWCLVRKNSQTSKKREYGRYSDSPDSEKDRPEAKKYADDIPVLMLFRQIGSEKQDWKTIPFWWPVLLCPKNTQISIYEGK